MIVILLPVNMAIKDFQPVLTKLKYFNGHYRYQQYKKD